MDFQPKRGATLLIPSGPKGNHLFVIVTEELGGEFLLVSISTIRENRYHDTTCLVPAGCHEFIRDPSYAHYGGARTDIGSRLVAMETAGNFFAKAEMPVEIVDNISRGIEYSPHTPNFAIKFWRRYARSLN